jgi:hypothetical protein
MPLAKRRLAYPASPRRGQRRAGNSHGQGEGGEGLGDALYFVRGGVS